VSAIPLEQQDAGDRGKRDTAARGAWIKLGNRQSGERVPAPEDRHDSDRQCAKNNLRKLHSSNPPSQPARGIYPGRSVVSNQGLAKAGDRFAEQHP